MKSTRDEPQLNLGLPPGEPTDAALREAFERCRLTGTFEEAMTRPAIALALKNVARAIERRRNQRKES